MITRSYVDRVRARRESRSLRDAIVFALVAGWALTIIGAFERFLVAGSNDSWWSAVGVFGLVILLAAVVDPRTVRPLYDGVHRAGVVVSGLAFRAILTVVYALMIVPAGLWIRRRRGTQPFYAWSTTPPADGEGWTAKGMPVISAREIDLQRTSTIREAASAVHYFIAIRRYVYLPVLIALIALGLILFIVQTSVLAPFIYTLF